MNKYFYLLFLVLVSCGQERFATNKYAENQSTSSIRTQNWNNPAYSQFTYVRPKVDFLIMIDNSGSYNYIKPKIEYSLRTLVDHISNDFDSQIALTTLFQTEFDEYYVITENPSKLNSVSSTKIIPLGEAGKKIISFPYSTEGREEGLDRTIDLYNRFKSKNVIRSGSHQMVVLISNGNHYRFDSPSSLDGAFAFSKYEEIKPLVSNSTQFRFFSIVPHSICEGVSSQVGPSTY
ncbi:MAG: hypothetical protein ACO2ZP_10315, partial [Bacteriovoracaceae bacterium]